MYNSVISNVILIIVQVFIGCWWLYNQAVPLSVLRVRNIFRSLAAALPPTLWRFVRQLGKNIVVNVQYNMFDFEIKLVVAASCVCVLYW